MRRRRFIYTPDNSAHNAKYPIHAKLMRVCDAYSTMTHGTLGKYAGVFNRMYQARNELLVLLAALGDARVPIVPLLVILGSILYLASPVDIIPDFVPIVGLVDDLFLVPLALMYAHKLIPERVLEDARIRGQKYKKALAGLVLVVAAVLVGFLVLGSIFVVKLFP